MKMRLSELLTHLRNVNVQLWVEKGQLHFRAPEGVMTPALRAEITQQKAEILAYLHDATLARHAPQSTIPTVPRTMQIPLSFAQERLWFLEQLKPGNISYNMPVAAQLRGLLDVSALESSFNEIVRRHEILRTTFHLREGQTYQAIFTHLTLTVPVVDLSELNTLEQEAAIRQLTQAEAQIPFDLSRGPLLRVRLLRQSVQEHVLLVTMHHIVSDGWSMGVLIREVASLYRTFTHNQPSPLPPLSIQYADFAHWQREWLQGERLDAQLAYWKQQLGGELSQLEGLLDKPRPSVPSLHSGRESLTLSISLSQELRRLSQQEDATLFMTMLAGFKLLLHRFTAVEDIVVGFPIAGRNRAELENLIGFFVNTLVLRTDLSGNPSFRELLGRVRKVALEAFAHQDVPFERLVEELRPERSLNRTPLFQVLFNLLGLDDETLQTLPGLTIQSITTPDVGTNFDLTLYLSDRSPAIELSLVYNPGLFFAERMREFLSQYNYLLSQIVEGPDQQIGSFSLVTNQAKNLLPDPALTLAEPEQVLLSQMFKEWVYKTPDQIALVQNEHSWTYAKLDQQASGIARLLIGKGIKVGDVVAVCGSRSFALIASMMAVFISGGVLLSVDPTLPDQRKRLMLREASTKALIYIRDEQPEISGWADPVLPENILIANTHAEDLVAAGIASDLPSLTLPQLSGNDSAYIFFTSGTTGTPKGVRGNHKGLSHFLSWQRDKFDIQPHDRVAQLTALSFDVVLRDIFLALVSGATLCLPEDNLQLDAEKTLKWLQESNISIVHTVPTLAKTWLASMPAGTSIPTLHWVFFAGEPLHATLVERWRSFFPHSKIVNLYGPTETTMAKCYYEVPIELTRGIQPVGHPLPQTQALVLNRNGQLCGIGEMGEIVLRTPFRTFGYINVSEENNKKFLKNPFRTDEQDLLYYTGDQGRYDPYGNIEFLGRSDSQVKVRGYRIELEAIETKLEEHPHVHEAVVSTCDDSIGNKYLVAYLVPEGTTEISAGELRAFLQRQLPDYMIPSLFIKLSAVPLTPNGKVDRRALPILELDRSDLSHTFVAPRTILEQDLARVWAEVLKLDKVGIHDNFFELGGHSLLATQVVSRLREIYQKDIPISKFFEVQTIAEWADFFDQDQDYPSFPSIASLTSEDLEEIRI